MTNEIETNRTVMVVFRATPAEREALAVHAAAKNMTVSQYIRAAVMYANATWGSTE